MPAPVIMVHGAFCGGWAFEAFKTPFEAAGHLCLCPDLPGHSSADRGRIAGQSMSDYTRTIADLIDTCDEAPVLIGHSMGGLVALMAATRRPVRGLVLLAPSSPWGVATNTMEDAAAAIGMIGISAYWTSGVDPDRSIFETYSADRLPKAEAAALFGRMVPESGRALSETLNWWLDPFMTTSVTASQIKAPILIITGGRDRVHPSTAVRQTAERYGARLQVFSDMSHWLMAEPGWQDVAAATGDWINDSLKAVA